MTSLRLVTCPVLAGALALAGCGARSDLVVEEQAHHHDAGMPEAFCPGPLLQTTTTLPLAAACAFDGVTSPGVAAIVDRQLVLVDGHGTPSSVHTFFADAADATPSEAFIASRGAFVGAMLVGYHQTADHLHVEVVVLDTRDGSVVRDAFDGVSVEFGQLGIWGNDTGTFVYPRMLDDGTVSGRAALGLISSTGGKLSAIRGIVPAGDPGADQRIPVYRQNDGGSLGPIAWFDPCTGKSKPSHAAKVGAVPEVLRARLIYVDTHTNTLFDEGAQDASSFPLHPLGKDLRLENLNASGWVLLSGDDPLVVVSAHPDFAIGHVVDLHALPEGFSLLDPLDGGTTPTGVRVDSSGDVMVALRNADHASLFVEHAGVWSPVGRPIGEVYDATPIGYGDTFLFYGEWQDVGSWPPPQGDRLDGTSTQLIRADSGVSIVLDFAAPPAGFNRNYELSHDAGCVSAYDAALDDRLHIANAATGAKTEIDLSPFPNPMRVFASTFIQGADVTFFAAPYPN